MKIACLFVFIFLVSCANVGKGRVSVVEIKSGSFHAVTLLERFGSPQDVRKGPFGSEIWVYRDYPLDFFYTVKDGIVVEKRMAGAGEPF